MIQFLQQYSSVVFFFHDTNILIFEQLISTTHYTAFQLDNCKVLLFILLHSLCTKYISISIKFQQNY